LAHELLYPVSAEKNCQKIVTTEGAIKMKRNQIKQTILTVSAVIMTALSLSACHGTGGYSGNYDPYNRAWYDVYGTRCISYGYPMAGCNFYSDGSKIRASEDPYYSNLLLDYDYWSYTDSYGYYRTYSGYAWLSSTGILYDEYGNALNEMDQEEAQSADVVAQAAKKEKEMAKQVGKTFAQKYALAESAGVSIAKTLQDWAVLARDRARNESDVANISKRLYGVKLDDAKAAIVEASKGNKAALEDVNVDIAAHWGTSPETSKEILSKWYKDELSQVGL
jgi:hypothetical protein